MSGLIEKRRDLSVDTLRGLACCLLVLCHVIGVNALNGLKIEEGFYRTVTDFLAYMRMPLFTFLSGYIYGWRPLKGKVKDFVSGKAIRLLVPMLVVGTTYAVMHSISSNIPYHWLNLHILPVNLYWFVESLFLIFMALIVLEKTGLLRTPRQFAITFTAASLLYASGFTFDSNYLSINGAFYLLPYFLAGLACYRFKIKIPSASLPVLLLALGYAFAGLIGVVEFTETRSSLALLIGVLSCYTLLRLGWENKFLTFIGQYSFGIYLFHIFFVVFSRKALGAIGLSNTELFILSGTLLGIIGPITIEKIASKNKLSNLLLFGIWQKNKSKIERKTPSQTETLSSK